MGVGTYQDGEKIDEDEDGVVMDGGGGGVRKARPLPLVPSPIERGENDMSSMIITHFS